MTDRVIPDGWESTTTTELIREKALLIGDGYRAKNSEFVDDGGLPFIRVGDITSRIRTDVRDELPLSRVEHYEPKVSQTNDSLITMKGTVGRVARVSSTTRRFVYSPQISFWRVRDPLRLWPDPPHRSTANESRLICWSLRRQLAAKRAGAIMPSAEWGRFSL